MNQRGFTLVELLVALSIFSVLSLASVGVFSIATRADEVTRDADFRLLDFERSRTLMRTDFLSVVARPYREASGRQVPPFMTGADAQSRLETNGDEYVIAAFVRAGWANPGALQPRSELQHVTYLVTGGNLVRRIRPFLDASRQTPRRDQILFEGIDDARLEIWGPRGWAEGIGRLPDGGLPRAVRLGFTHPVYGELHQNFMVEVGS